MTRPHLTDPPVPDLARLKWVGVWIPVAGLGLVLGLAGGLTLSFPDWYIRLAAYLTVMVLITAGAYLFSHSVFRVVQQKEREILRRNQELATLNAVGVVINEFRDLDEILTRTLDKVLEVTGAESGEIFLRTEDSEWLELRALRGLYPTAFQEITQFELGEGFPGRIAKTGKPIVLHNLPEDPRFLRTKVKEKGFHSYAGVPLASKGRVVGVMAIFALDPELPTAEDVELLETLGKQIGVAIENARLLARMEAMTVVEERHRIAREMHDGLAQELGYIHLKLGELEANPSVARAREDLGLMKAVVARAYENVRHAIFGLKMMVSQGLGLVPTLAEYLHEFGSQTGIPVKLKVADERAARLSPQVEIQLIRIIQEALSNVRRHAQAREAWLTFDSDGVRAEVTIQDNGRGFDLEEATCPGRASFGLQTMRERAESTGGSLLLESRVGKGTRVLASLPLVGNEKRNGAHEDSTGG